MRYEIITADGLHAVWPTVKVGIGRVKEMSEVPWIAEDVYAHLRAKWAVLHMVYDSTYRGFFVLETKRIPHSGEMSLHVWLCYADPIPGKDHFADVRGLINDALEHLDACAREVKATTMTFDGRYGWTRFLGEAFKPTTVHMERKVP